MGLLSFVQSRNNAAKTRAQIKATIRQENLLVRYGGDEFIIVSKGCDSNGATVIVERIIEKVKNNIFKFKNKKIPVTISMGFAVLHNKNFKSPEELFEKADAHLYDAKAKGKNTYMCEDKSDE